MVLWVTMVVRAGLMNDLVAKSCGSRFMTPLGVPQ